MNSPVRDLLWAGEKIINILCSHLNLQEVFFVSISFFAASLQTFDECVLKKRPECVDPNKIFYIVPFFCGQEAFCRLGFCLILFCTAVNFHNY